LVEICAPEYIYWDVVVDIKKTTLTPKQTIIIGLFSSLVLSCGQQTDNAEPQRSAELADTNSVQATPDMNERIENQETLSPYQQELDKTLNDPTVDQYFKGIYNQEKLIIAEDSKMLSVADSLTSKDPDNDLFYFVVFTKSMNGSDGFYSEAVGLAAFNYVTKQTEEFADYFNIAPKLTDKDMDNWASYIFGEIQISRENHELQAVDELEKQLIGNIKGARKEYKVVIEKLIEKIESTAHTRGYKQAGG
jgi:hypothetical protein